MNKYTKSPFFAPLATVLLLLVGVYIYGLLVGPITISLNEQDPKRTFTVDGKGTVDVVPDTFQTTFTVQENGETQEEAQTLGNEKQNLALVALKELGFEENDIKTQNYNIYPNYDYIRPEGREEPTGFQFSQSTSIETKDKETINQALDELAAIGINVSGVQIQADQDKYAQAAREKAIEDAKQKAEDLARAGDFKIGKIASIQEGATSAPGYPLPLRGIPEPFMEETQDAATSIISPGTEEVTAHVTITYYIND